MINSIINEFLETKYSEPLIIKTIPAIDVTELYLRSGQSLLAYGFVRKGYLYGYIDWDVPTGTLNEVSAYFGINILVLEKIMLEWMKNKVSEQGYKFDDASILKHLK